MNHSAAAGRKDATAWSAADAGALKTSGGDAPRELLEEEPLSIVVQGEPYAVVMRTPGDEVAHVAGFCLAEGLVDGLDDFHRIKFCDREASNVVAVTLTKQRCALIPDRLRRRSFLSQTSCGICGKVVMDDLLQVVRPFDDDVMVSARRMTECVQSLCARQWMRDITKASHGAALYDMEHRLLTMAEDVGRHNAVDKAVGRLFLRDELSRAAILLVTSRVSYELVQKAARARIPIVLALSHPTALAVELADKLNMTLITIREHARASVYCGGRRLRDAWPASP